MRVRTLLAVAVAVGMVAGSVQADPIEDAKAHFRQGTGYFALTRYGDAAREYEAAFALTPDPALLYNAAQAHRLAGNKQRAFDLYSSYLRVYGSRIHNREDVERRIADLQHEIDADAKKQRAVEADVRLQPPSAALNAPSSVAPAASSPPTTVPLSTLTLTTAPSPRDAEQHERKRKLGLWIGVGAGALVVGVVAIALGVVYGQKDPHASATVSY